MTTGRTETTPQPLAELATVTEACDRLEDTVTSEKDRWATAQHATAETRRRQHPGRTTWAPNDQEEPVPAPPEVVDGEERRGHAPATEPGTCSASTPPPATTRGTRTI